MDTTDRLEVNADIEREQARRQAGRGLLAMGGLMAAALLLAGMATALGLLSPATRSAAAGDSETLGFDLTLFDGDRLTEADLHGRVTVLNVWASWCGPCREEAPALRRLDAESDPARVAFLGVAARDAEAPAREFVDRFGIEYPNALDDGAVASRYNVTIMPTTLVFDAQGALVTRFAGAVTEARLRTLIDDALAASVAAP